MFLLVREVSPYVPDILLGVFTTADDAERARAYYLAATTAGGDPWEAERRAFFTSVAGHSTIIAATGEFPQGARVFVVADYREGFGQVTRRFDSIHATAEAADRRVRELDAVDDPEDVFPHYALVDAIRVGVLHSDAPEHQPRPSWEDDL